MNRTFIDEAYRNVGRGTGGSNGAKRQPVFVYNAVIEPQRNSWSCGPHALRNAMASHGRITDVEHLGEIAGANRKGTDEFDLMKAARACDHELFPFEYGSQVAFKRRLTLALSRGNPLILCTENGSHWISLFDHTKRRGYLVMDSSRPGPVIQLVSWKRLVDLLRYRPDPKKRATYFAMELFSPWR